MTMTTENERLVVIIERDDMHMEHMWADVERGWQERKDVLEEADSIDAGNYTPYGVTTAKVCDCCGQVTEQYVTAVWGCVVESANQAGCYELDNLDAITDDYLRDVAREVIVEAEA